MAGTMRAIAIAVAVAACASPATTTRTMVPPPTRPNGDWVAPAPRSGVVSRIAIEMPREDASDEGRAPSPTALWSPDGKLFFDGSDLRDGITGTIRAMVSEPQYRSMWSADSSALVLVTYWGAVVTVRADGSITRLPAQKDRMITDFGVAAIDAAATRLFVGGMHSSALWDLTTGNRIADLVGPHGKLREPRHVVTDGKTLFVAGEDGTVDRYSLATGALIDTQTYSTAQDRYPEAMAISGSGTVGIMTLSGIVYIVGGGVSPQLPAGDDHGFPQLAWSGGRWVMARANAATWDGKSQALSALHVVGSHGDLPGIQAGGGRVAFEVGGHLQVFADDGHAITTLPPGQLSSNGKRAVVSAGAGLAMIDIDSGSAVASVPALARQAIEPSIASPDGTQLWSDGVTVTLATGHARADADPIAPIRDRPERIQLADVEVELLARAPDGTLLVVSRCDTGDCVCVADARTGQCRVELEHADTSGAWSWSSDSKHLAHVLRDSHTTPTTTIELYDAHTGNRERTIPDNATAVAWASPHILGTVDADGRIRLLRLNDGAVLYLVTGRGLHPGLLAVDDDGHFDGDDPLRTRVQVRDGVALTAPLHSLAESSMEKLRTPGMYAAFLMGR
jgi:WD40 repeat protein